MLGIDDRYMVIYIFVMHREAHGPLYLNVQCYVRKECILPSRFMAFCPVSDIDLRDNGRSYRAIRHDERCP